MASRADFPPNRSFVPVNKTEELVAFSPTLDRDGVCVFSPHPFSSFEIELSLIAYRNGEDEIPENKKPEWISATYVIEEAGSEFLGLVDVFIDEAQLPTFTEFLVVSLKAINDKGFAAKKHFRYYPAGTGRDAEDVGVGGFYLLSQTPEISFGQEVFTLVEEEAFPLPKAVLFAEIENPLAATEHDAVGEITATISQISPTELRMSLPEISERVDTVSLDVRREGETEFTRRISSQPVGAFPIVLSGFEAGFKYFFEASATVLNGAKTPISYLDFPKRDTGVSLESAYNNLDIYSVGVGATKYYTQGILSDGLALKSFGFYITAGTGATRYYVFPDIKGYPDTENPIFVSDLVQIDTADAWREITCNVELSGGKVYHLCIGGHEADHTGTFNIGRTDDILNGYEGTFTFVNNPGDYNTRNYRLALRYSTGF